MFLELVFWWCVILVVDIVKGVPVSAKANNVVTVPLGRDRYFEVDALYKVQALKYRLNAR